MPSRIEFTGLEEAIEKFTALDQGLPTVGLEGIEQDAFPIYYALADYPDERPGQTYVRTYDLRDSVYANVAVNGNEATFDFGATDPAMYWTRGTADGSYGGAWMNAHWRKFKDIMDTLLPVVVSKVIDRIDAFIRRVMG